MIFVSVTTQDERLPLLLKSIDLALEDLALLVFDFVVDLAAYLSESSAH